MDDAQLLVNGVIYSGWKSVRITRSIESAAGSFDLEASDRWAEASEPWGIVEEDECSVAIGDKVLIDGFVDRRTISLSAQQRTLSYAGRDRAAVLVDCTALLDKYSFRRFDPVSFIAEVAGRFGVGVTAQAGLSLDRIRKLTVNPGDTAWQVIERVAMAAGVLVVSAGDGTIEVTRSGSAMAAPLVEGRNMLEGSVAYDGSQRYHRYVVAASVAGDDEASGNDTRIRAEALDNGVRRTDRVLMLRPEQGLSTDRARVRGDWEARLRAARAETVSLTVHGWMQPNGEPWPVNALCPVVAPGLGVDGTLLISEAEYILDGGGQVTRLRLVRPDAFSPEPRAEVRNPTKKSQPEPTLPGPRGSARIAGNKWKGGAR